MTLAVVAVLPLAECDAVLPIFVPTRPNDGLVSLTVVDGYLAFVPCTGEGARLRDLVVNVGPRDADGMRLSDPVPVLESAYVPYEPELASVSDPLPNATPIVVGEPIPGLELTTAVRVSVDDYPLLSAGIRFIDSENGTPVGWADFPPTDFRELGSGEFLYWDGRVSTDPCGMYDRD